MSEMSEMAAAPKAGAVHFGGRLTVSHPNGRRTGSMAQFVLCPATQDEAGGVVVSVYPQKETQGLVPLPPEFDMERGIEIRLSPVEVAECQMVFRGYTEGVRDGNGFFHRKEDGTVVMTLSHAIEPTPGYRLSLTRRVGFGNDSRRDRVQILLTIPEMYALAGAIDGAMGYIAFGVPMAGLAGEGRGA